MLVLGLGLGLGTQVLVNNTDTCIGGTRVCTSITNIAMRGITTYRQQHAIQSHYKGRVGSSDKKES